MSTIEKRIQKFYRTPVPNDITFEDVEALAAYYRCLIRTGGNHSKKVVHIASDTWKIYQGSICERVKKTI